MKKLLRSVLWGLFIGSGALLAADIAYLKLGVADADLNTDSQTKQSVEVLVTSEHGEEERVLLTETGNNTARFTNTIAIVKTEEQGINNDGKFYLNKNSKLKVSYLDHKYGASGGEKELESTILVLVDSSVDTDGETASSGGGCSVNPQAKSFDMMFFILFALALLYPLRRKLHLV